jgi:hypothetical protein
MPTPSVTVDREPGKADMTILNEIKEGPKRYTYLVAKCREKHCAKDNTTVEYSLKKLSSLEAVKKDKGLWAKGPKFDEILNNTYKKLADRDSIPSIYSLKRKRENGNTHLIYPRWAQIITTKLHNP